MTASPPPNLPDAKAKEFVDHSYGLIVLARDDASYQKYTSRLDDSPADGGVLRTYIGSPSTRIVVQLPAAAPPDLAPRIKAVVSQFARASN
jgi:hypothetical protein